LDLDNASVGNDYSTLETSGGTAAIANNPVVTDGANNAEGQIKSITLHLTAAVGTPDTDHGEGLQFPASLASALSTLGIATVSGATAPGQSRHRAPVVPATHADYTVTRIGSGVDTVANSALNRDATDTVHDVETLHFRGDTADLLLDAPILVFDSTDTALLAS